MPRWLGLTGTLPGPVHDEVLFTGRVDGHQVRALSPTLLPGHAPRDAVCAKLVAAPKVLVPEEIPGTRWLGHHRLQLLGSYSSITQTGGYWLSEKSRKLVKYFISGIFCPSFLSFLFLISHSIYSKCLGRIKEN